MEMDTIMPATTKALNIWALNLITGPVPIGNILPVEGVMELPILEATALVMVSDHQGLNPSSI